MEGSVLSFLKAEWKVSDKGSAHWASSFNVEFGLLFQILYFSTLKLWDYSKGKVRIFGGIMV